MGRGVGFDNFVQVIQDFRFGPAVLHVALFVLFWLAGLVLFVVVLSLLVHGLARRGLSTGLRFVYYIPGALAGASSVMLWLFVLDPTASPVSWVLHALGTETFVQTVSPGNLPVIFAIIAFWTGAGGWIVVLYGALNNVPGEVMEAGKIDGAGRLRTALSIQLPMMRKWISYMAVMSLAAARIDGCGELAVFTRIALPLAKPVVALVGFFSFVANWNNYFLPFLVAPGPKAPIQVGLAEMLANVPQFNPTAAGVTTIELPALALATVLSVAPVLLIFLFSQRFLVAGMTAGGTKE